MEKLTVTVKLQCLAVTILLLLSLSAFAAARKEAKTGGWSPIKNIIDPHVREIADFAVTEYDKRSGATLKLEKVIKGDTQVVAGTNYRLVLAVTDESTSTTKNYEARVWEKPWQHYRNLTSFKPLHHG